MSVEFPYLIHFKCNYQFLEFGLPILADRMVMMYPPTYEDAMQQPQIPNSPPHKHSPYVSMLYLHVIYTVYVTFKQVYICIVQK